MSMSFYAYNSDREWVFTDEEMREGEWIDNPNDSEYADFVRNEKYLPFADINLATGNCIGILEFLGFKVEDGQFEAASCVFLDKVTKAYALNHDDYTKGVISKLFDFARVAVKRGAINICAM